MNQFMNAMVDTTNVGYTENGGIKRNTTKSDLLDMFAMGGAYRNRSDEDVILMFQKAYAENPVYALKCLFYLRDVRGGQGERRFFRVAMKWLARHDKAAALRNLKLTPEFGRWDDLYLFVGTALEKDAFAFMKEQLALDITCKTPSLLAKWLKSENTSSSESRALANKTRAAFGMSHKQYRKTLSMLRERINVLERLMSAQKWDEIEFDKIPSKAGLIYKNAFAKHDVERMKNAAVQSYADFAQDDTKKVNAEVLNPVDIAHRVFTGQVRSNTDIAMLDKYWANLKDYYNGREENGIAICDVSGSMCGQPMEAAVSMSAYIAERGKGPFKDHFLTFSDNPQFVRFEGANIADKFNRAQRADWGGSTNIEAAMNLLLKVAVENKVPAEDIPTRLYIFSDMEFNGAMTYGEPVRGWYGSRNYVDDVDTLFETIEKRWARHGYEMPKVIFWNLDAKTQNIPALGGKFSYISGFSMTMLEQVLSGYDGYDLMMAKLDSERYSCVG